MTMIERVLWGLLAGLAIVLVKILGPDEQFFRSLLVPQDGGASEDLAAELIFYFIISVITVLLGGIAGAFAKENDKTRILLFAVSFPALLTTMTAQKRDAVGNIGALAQSDLVEASPASQMANLSPMSLIISKAYAIDQDVTTCVEAGFGTKILQSAAKYLGGRSNASEKIYAVVIASTKDLNQAKEIANEALLNTDLQVYVGCKRPGNEYFPVIVGETTNQFDANELKGIVTEQRLLSDGSEPYISSYAYRTSIYDAR